MREVGSNSSAIPARWQRSKAQGTSVMKLSALCSIKNPSRRTVCNTPPKRGPASSSNTSSVGASSANRQAAASPLMPPPMTTRRRFGVLLMLTRTSIPGQLSRPYAEVVRLWNPLGTAWSPWLGLVPGYGVVSWVRAQSPPLWRGLLTTPCPRPQVSPFQRSGDLRSGERHGQETVPQPETGPQPGWPGLEPSLRRGEVPVIDSLIRLIRLIRMKDRTTLRGQSHFAGAKLGQSPLPHLTPIAIVVGVFHKNHIRRGVTSTRTRLGW